MGFFFRAAVVIGTIYAISPLRDAGEPLVPRIVQERLATGAGDLARQAVSGAAGLCKERAAACLQAAAAMAPKPAGKPSLAERTSPSDQSLLSNAPSSVPSVTPPRRPSPTVEKARAAP